MGRYTAPMPSLPVVAIVGRPNVGKSTLFNRMVGERAAIVEDTAGTTRDRVYGEADWNGRRFMMVDTGGLELAPGSTIEERVQDQAQVAIEEADVVLFVVDAAAGLAPLDHEVADRLRRAHRPTILVINKADNPRREAEGAEFYALGFDPAITISAQHGRNTGDLADLIVDRLPAKPDPAEPEPEPSVSSDDSRPMRSWPSWRDRCRTAPGGDRRAPEHRQVDARQPGPRPRADDRQRGAGHDP